MLILFIFVYLLLYNKVEKKKVIIPPSLTLFKKVRMIKDSKRAVSPYTGDHLLTELYPYANNNSLNQGECGSCWAFATAKAIAFAYRRYYKVDTKEGIRSKYLYQAVDYNNTRDSDNLTDSSTIKNSISPFYLGSCTKGKDVYEGATLEEALEYAKRNPLSSILANTQRFTYSCPSSFPSNSPKFMIEHYEHLGYKKRKCRSK